MKETEHRLSSRLLSNERSVWIREPDEAPTHLVVFLDAELYRERVGAVSLIDDLVAARAIESALFVFISTESVAARWLECPCYPPFARFVEEEFFPWLEEMYPATRSLHNRVIVGLSYTGLAAAYLAMMAPTRFTRVIAQSGSFWWNDCWLAGHFGDLAIKPKTEFYLEVGRRETAENVRHQEDVLQVVSQIEGVRRFRDALEQSGYQPQYVEFEGGHEMSAWRSTLPAALRWALATASGKAARTLLLFLSSLLLIFQDAQAADAGPACVFCDIAAGKASPDSVIYRDDLVVAFMDRAPRNPGHVLVVPIQHADGLLDAPPATLGRLAQVAQQIALAIKKTSLKAEGFNIQSNTGKAAGQSVGHLHVHVIPRFVGEPAYRGETDIAPPEEVAAVAKELRAVLAVGTSNGSAGSRP